MKPFRKTTHMPAPGFIFFLLLGACCVSFTNAQSFRSFSTAINPFCSDLNNRNHEFVNTEPPDGFFYCNPLMLDDVAFAYHDFTLESEGELKVIKEDSKTKKKIEIPFHLYLRRNGTLIAHPCGAGVIFSKLEISTIMKFARNGEELIIDPVNKGDWPAKRIVRLGDGC